MSKYRDSSTGFIQLPRNFFLTHHWREHRTFSYAEAYIDIIQSARYTDTPTSILIRGRTVTWGRGQGIAGQRFLAKRWGWSRDRVRNFIAILVAEQVITTDKSQYHTVFTVITPKTDHQSNRQTNHQEQPQDSVTPDSTTNDRPPNQTSDTTTDPTVTVRMVSNKEERKNTVIPYGHDDPSFISEYSAWIEYKKERRQSLPASTIQSQNAWLKKFPLAEALEIIRVSIRNNWSGLFELKETNTRSAKQSGANQLLASIKSDLTNPFGHLKELKGPGDFWNEMDYLNYKKQEGTITREESENLTKLMKSL